MPSCGAVSIGCHSLIPIPYAASESGSPALADARFVLAWETTPAGKLQDQSEVGLQSDGQAGQFERYRDRSRFAKPISNFPQNPCGFDAGPKKNQTYVDFLLTLSTYVVWLDINNGRRK